MYLIDTNIHAAWLLQSYENDEETRKYLKAYEQIPLIDRLAADFLLNELELLLLKAVPLRFKMTPVQEFDLREAVFDYLHDIFANFTLVTPSPQTLKFAYDLYKQFAHSKYISFTDSLILALASHNDFKIFSKDRRLNDVASQMGLFLFKV